MMYFKLSERLEPARRQELMLLTAIPSCSYAQPRRCTQNAAAPARARPLLLTEATD